MFEPVGRSRAFERVVEQIEQAIYSGRLQQGQHLPPERALVDQFGVGRSTVREALRILESMGLLETAPGSPLGAQVTGSNVAGLHRALHGFIRLEKIGLADLVQYRMISGSAANFLASHLRTEEHLAQIAAIIKTMESVGADQTHEFAEQDLLFHQAITNAAGNGLLKVINDAINDQIVNLMSEAIDQSTNRQITRDSFLDLHRRLYRAIEQRNGELASYLARNSLFEVYSPLLSTADQARLRILIPNAGILPSSSDARADFQAVGLGQEDN